MSTTNDNTQSDNRQSESQMQEIIEQNNKTWYQKFLVQDWKYVFAFSYLFLIILQAIHSIIDLLLRGGGGGEREGNELSPSFFNSELAQTLRGIYSIVNETSTFLHKR